MSGHGEGCPICGGWGYIDASTRVEPNIIREFVCPECARVTSLIDRAVQPYKDALRDVSTVMDGAVQHGYTPSTARYASDWARVHLRANKLAGSPLPPPDAAGGGA